MSKKNKKGCLGDTTLELLTIAKAILKESLKAINPEFLIKKKIVIKKGNLIIKESQFPLNSFKNIWILGAGKASIPMAKGLTEILNERITGGFLIRSEKIKSFSPKITIEKGSHPVPDGKSLYAALEMEKFIKSNIRKNDLVFFLLSGGASSLMAYPDHGISIEEKANLTRSLLESGADINEINAIRKHVSKFKGGKLARYLYPVRVFNLILSDVIENRIDSIGSGPLVADSSTWKDCWKIFKKHKLLELLPEKIRKIFEKGKQGKLKETPKKGNKIFDNIYNFIIGKNLDALKAANEEAIKHKFNSSILTSSDRGEAKEVAKLYGAIIKEIVYSDNPVKKPACIISGGELTVTVKGKGKGGRNQEFILALLNELKELQGEFLCMSIGTDGIDGPTDAAGAWIDHKTWKAIKKKRLNPEKFLSNNDSYNFFKNSGNLIITGKTFTNVGDMRIFLIP
ncbi:MAG: glycerate kinase [Acidobacteriota bacterium]